MCFYDVWRGYSAFGDGECDIEFIYDDKFYTFVSIIEFIFPLTTLIVLNLATYVKIRNRGRKVAPAISQSQSKPGNSVVVSSASNRNKGPEVSSEEASKTRGPQEQPKQSSESGQQELSTRSENSCHHEAKVDTDASKKDVKSRGSNKAARSLSIVVLVFVLLWTPYCLVNVMGNFCPCITQTMYDITNFGLWSTTVWNPIIYFTTNQVMRDKYKKMICPYSSK